MSKNEYQILTRSIGDGGVEKHLGNLTGEGWKIVAVQFLRTGGDGGGSLGLCALLRRELGTPQKGVADYVPDSILTVNEVAAALQIEVEEIEKLGVPASYALGPDQPRYLWRHVVSYVEDSRALPAPDSRRQ
jgi:hypothetical protein